jgi:hypothetical protein
MKGIEETPVVVYTGVNNANPELEAAQGTIMAMACIVPGDREFRVRLPDGEKLTCTSELQNTGWHAGWDVKQDRADWRTVTFRMPVQEGQFSAGTYIMCATADQDGG